jgi:hypothetical protein
LRDAAQGEKEKNEERETTSRAHCHITLQTLPASSHDQASNGLVNAGTQQVFHPPTVSMPAKGRYFDRTSMGQGFTLSCEGAKGVNSKPGLFQTIGLWPLYERFKTSFQF